MRRTELKRRMPLTRRTRLRPVNRERRLERYAAAFGDRGELVRAMPCICLGNECHGPIEAAHTKSRGAGGSRRDMVPLCARHHRRQHDRGIQTFEHETGVDLRAAAARIAVELDARGIP